MVDRFDVDNDLGQYCSCWNDPICGIVVQTRCLYGIYWGNLGYVKYTWRLCWMSMVVLLGWVLFFKALYVDVRNLFVFDLVIFMQARVNFKVQLWNWCVKSSVVEDRWLFLYVAGPSSKSSVSGVTLQVVTLEDVVEEIVGEIFDENDSKVCLISARWYHCFCPSVHL